MLETGRAKVLHNIQSYGKRIKNCCKGNGFVVDFAYGNVSDNVTDNVSEQIGGKTHKTFYGGLK